MDRETVFSRFREVAARYGARAAVREGDVLLTYGELQARAKKFSAWVQATDLTKVPVVGISLSRVSHAMPAMLGVLQAGRAFTFIDSRAAIERKLAVADEMALGLVLGEGEAWTDYLGQWIDVTTKPAKALTESVPPPESACCIVQTSGTTGRPLGIEISHAAMLHAIDNYTELARLCPDDRLALLTSGAHFAALSAIFGALLNGACLCPFDVRRDGFSALADGLEKAGITIYQSPPSLFRAFFRQVRETRRFPALRFIRLGGEPLLAADFELFQQFFPAGVELVNAFGISEAAGNVTYLRLDRDVAYSGPILPVGIAAPGREIFLLDPEGKPAAAGEIVVRSDFLATGYYRRPDLTEQKFRGPVDGKARELRTGDLGHVTPEGWLVHDGRKDHEIKIRGQRVNLSGLETILRALPGVHDARVLFAAEEEQLVAFVVAPAPIELPELPIAPCLIYLLELPLTAGGKVDREKLLAYRRRSASAPPRDETEEFIAGIWREVLQIHDLGVYDDFFTLGGDSLKALRICSALEKHYGRKFPPFLFLQGPTVAQLGEFAAARAKWSGWLPVTAREKSERVVALSPPRANSQAPLFICPGGWGHERELLVFAALLPHLPADLPVYGLKQNFLRTTAKVAGNITTMAKNFVREIRRIQPAGPYRLVGECVAVFIALEVAHRLSDNGGLVERLILLDPRLPRSQQPDTGTESAEVAAKVSAYYRTLIHAKPRACHYRVEVIGTDDAETLRRRLEPWGVFDPAQLHFTRVPGDHLTYLRAHRAETAGAIARLLA